MFVVIQDNSDHTDGIRSLRHHMVDKQDIVVIGPFNTFGEAQTFTVNEGTHLSGSLVIVPILQPNSKFLTRS